MNDLAIARGFEPPTYRLGGGRSILLSYAIIWPHVIIAQLYCLIKTTFQKHYKQREHRHHEGRSVNILAPRDKYLPSPYNSKQHASDYVRTDQEHKRIYRASNMQFTPI